VKRALFLAIACSVLSLLPKSTASQISVRTPPAATAPPQALPRSSEPNGGVWQLPDRERVNESSVTIMTGPVGGLTPMMGSDLARVLDGTGALRVLPVVGKGSVQNVIDIMYLKSIDMGFVVSDVVEFFKIQYNVQNIETRLRYITKLYNNEVYIVAPSSIKTIYDLAGKKVMAPKDVGFFSARIIFSRLNINATFDYETDDTLALQRVIDGQADAWIVSVGKIFPIARGIKNENGRLHLVSIPYEKSLFDLYYPSRFTSDEYPNLIPAGEEVETLATGVILASFNWPENSERYKKVARFTDAFFSKNAEFLKPPRNPKWREMNIAAKVLGWTRFKGAQDWLDRNASDPKSATSDEFKQFIAQSGFGSRNNLSEDELAKLFKGYTEWVRTKR
jgi:TRAP-type uncharacterized transport system substrate-binding protein